jgi:hypothetical protein
MLQNDQRSQPGPLDTFTLQTTAKVTLDLLVLRYMAHRIRAHLLNLSDDTVTPSIEYAKERRGRVHRMVVYNRQAALVNGRLIFVGFISGVQEQVSLETVHELRRMDKLLVEELASNPGLLTYSSLELHKRCWYNFVLLRDELANAYFRQNSTHRYAAHQLARYYYAWIRLHRGTLPCGLPSFGDLDVPIEPGGSSEPVCNEMVLSSTRYFTFPEIGQPPIIWHTVPGQA